MANGWDRVVRILQDQNDKVLWRQLIVTLVDKGLLGLIVVGVGLCGNWLLEGYKIRQTEIQSQAQLLLVKRLESIQKLADVHGKLTGSFMASTLGGVEPTAAQVKEFNGYLEELFLLTNQFEIVLSEDFDDEIERQLWIYKGISHEKPAEWASYRGFVADLAITFEWAWRQSLPSFDGASRAKRTEAPFETVRKTVQQVTQDGTKTYFEENLARWKKQTPAQIPYK